MTLSPRFDPYRAAMVSSVIPLAKAAEPEMPPVVYTLLGVPYTVVPDRRYGFLFKAARRKPAPGQMSLFDAPKAPKAPGTGGRKKMQEGATRMKNGRQQVLKNSRWRNVEPKDKATPKPGLAVVQDKPATVKSQGRVSDAASKLKPKARKGKAWGAEAPAKAPAAVGGEAMGATSLRPKGGRKDADKDIDVAKIRRVVGINIDQALSDSIDKVNQARSDSGKISRELAHTALIAADAAHNGYLTLGNIAYHHNIGGHAKYTEPLTDVFAQHPDLKEQYPEVAKAVIPRDSKKPWFATHEYDDKEDIWADDDGESPDTEKPSAHQSEYDNWLDWSESEEARSLSPRATKIAMYAAVNNFDNLIGGIDKRNWSKDEVSAVIGRMVDHGFVSDDRLEKFHRLANNAPATPVAAEVVADDEPTTLRPKAKPTLPKPSVLGDEDIFEDDAPAKSMAPSESEMDAQIEAIDKQLKNISDFDYASSDSPGSLALENFIKDKDYSKWMKANYFDESGQKTGSSRFNPASLPNIPVGAWKMDGWGSLYGHQIEQLVEITPDMLSEFSLSEDMVSRNEEGRGDDADRYAGWMQDGKEAPPVTVVQMDNGKYKVSDGHRRVAAAIKSGKPLKAWVSFAVPNGKTDYSGNPMMTGLTYELAKHQGFLSPLFNVEDIFERDELDSYAAGRLQSARDGLKQELNPTHWASEVARLQQQLDDHKRYVADKGTRKGSLSARDEKKLKDDLKTAKIKLDNLKEFASNPQPTKQSLTVPAHTHFDARQVAEFGGPDEVLAAYQSAHSKLQEYFAKDISASTPNEDDAPATLSTLKPKGKSKKSTSPQYKLGPSETTPYLVDVSGITSTVSRSAFDADQVESLAQSILESGGLLSPIVLKQTGPESFEVLAGDLEYHAAARAKELDPRKGEMVNAYVVPPQNQAAAVEQVNRAKPTVRPKKGDSTSPQYKLGPSETKHYLVDVSGVTSTVSRSAFDADQVESLAQSILESGGLLSPIVLKQTGPESYEVLAGDLEYHAAARAKELDPRKGEMVNAYVVPPQNQAAAVAQVTPATPVWESKLNELKQLKQAGPEISSPPKKDDEAKAGPSPIPYDRHLLRNRISQGYMETRAFYARAVNALDNALMNGKEVKIYPDDVSSYGAKLVMEIDGKREPLTKSKLKKKDLAFFLSANVLSTLDL